MKYWFGHIVAYFPVDCLLIEITSLFQLNVVGTKRIKGIHTCTMEDLQWCLDGNLKTTFMMTQACLPYLEESKGQIINMSSFSGSRPVSV